MPRVQLVVPCYNEGRRLQSGPFLQAVATWPDVSILFVNDGSTDDTGSVLAALAAGSGGRLTVLSLPRNGGKAAAVRSGVLVALGCQPEFVGYWDADLATPLFAVQDFIDVFDANREIDIVMGARVRLLGRHIERYALRHYSGRLFATAASWALDMPVYDTQCGAKLLRVNARTRHAFSAPFRSRWIFDVELLARYIAVTGKDAARDRIYELPLMTWTDVPGSKVRPWHGVQAMWDVARIWRQSGRAVVLSDVPADASLPVQTTHAPGSPPTVV
jgi:glycosyltransferase involved in cell wall biosynthesis